MGIINRIFCFFIKDINKKNRSYPQETSPGDFLAMNVHKWQCNSKMKSDKDAERLSFVFYLREKMIKACPRSKFIHKIINKYHIISFFFNYYINKRKEMSAYITFLKNISFSNFEIADVESLGIGNSNIEFASYNIYIGDNSMPMFKIYEFQSSSQQEQSGDKYLEFLYKGTSLCAYSYDLLVNLYYLVEFIYNDNKRSHVKTGLMNEIRQSIIETYPQKAEFDQLNNPILKINANSEITSCPTFRDCPPCQITCPPCQSPPCPNPDNSNYCISSGLSWLQILIIVLGSLFLVIVVIIFTLLFTKKYKK